MALPRSSLSPTRPSAVAAAIGGMTSVYLAKASSAILVRVGPGATPLTRIPRGAELFGQVPRQHDEPTLHGGVGGVPLGEAGGDRRVAGGVHDRSTVGDEREKPLGQEVRAPQDHPEELVEQLLTGVHEHVDWRQRCVLNEWYQPALSVSEPRLPGQGGGGGLVRSRVGGSQLVSTSRWDRRRCTRTTSMRRTASRRRPSIGSARRTCWIAIAVGRGPRTRSEISLSPFTKKSTDRSRIGPGICRAARRIAYRSEPDGGQPDRTRTITSYRAIFDHASPGSPRSSAGVVKAR